MRNKAVILGIIIVFLVPITATANDFYIFAGIGPTTWDTNDAGIEFDSSVAYQLGAGKELDESTGLFIEGLYINYGLGAYEDSDTFGDGTFIDTEASAIAAKIGLKRQLSKTISVSVKLGVEQWSGETLRQVVPGTGPIVRTETSDSGTDLSYGVGLEYMLLSGSSIRVDLKKLDINTGDSELGLTTWTIDYVKRFK